MIADLQVCGLIRPVRRGVVGPGAVSLDDIAAAHELAEKREERLAKHREERAAWRSWLIDRERQREAPAAEPISAETAADAADDADDAEHSAWLAAVMATGPPGHLAGGDELEAIELVAELLGGRILAGAGRSVA
jgi:hypothetical protein